MEYNNYPSYSFEPSVSRATYTARVFGWMFLGLLTTFAVALATIYTDLWRITCSSYLPFVLAIAEVAVVVILSARIHKLSVSAARGMFFLYAVLNGVTFSSLLLLYSLSSLIMVFGMTALYFGVMAAYAWFTKADLSYLRPVLLIGLVVLLVVTLISMLFGFSGNSRILSIFGVLLFVGYTAYDTQKIRADYEFYMNDAQMLEKASVISALQLYLDFINLFIYLLRLYGKRKN